MSLKLSEIIDLGHSQIAMREDGIVQMNFYDKLEIDIKEAKEMVAATNELTHGKKVLVLNIAGSNTTATKEAREYAASKEAVEFTLAEAYVIRNLAQKILGTFYINFNKPLVPTKLFTSEEEAVIWLKSLVV